MNVKTKTQANPSNRKEDWLSEVLLWRRHPTFHRQLVAFLCAFCGNTASGITISLTGTLLSNVREYVRAEDDHWMAGCNLIFTAIGIFLSSFVMRKYGRKPALMYSNIPWIIGWIILHFSDGFWTIILGIGLVGFSSGFSNNAVVVYVIEVPEPKLRGFLASFANIFFSGGIFVGHLLGVSLPWRTAVVLYAIFPGLALTFSFFLHESPNWLMINGRVEDAKEVFFWLRGVSPESQAEYNTLLEKRSENRTKQNRGVIQNLFSREFFQPFFVMVVMFAVAIGSGIDILVYYAIDILEAMFKETKTMDAETVLVMINAVRVVMGAVSTVLIKKFRRKPLFYLSTMGTLLFLVNTIVSIQSKCVNSDAFLILNLCLYIGAANVGLVPIPWIMIAEIFPQILRDIGSGVVHMYFYFLSFILVQVNPKLLENFGLPKTMSIYAGFTFFCTILLCFVMPETEKYTLQEVEDKVRRNRSTEITNTV